MKDKIRDESMDFLFQAMLSLETEDECFAFFQDVCTISELKAMAQRLTVAKMLKEGKTYTEIFEKTHVSTATISRVNRCLEYGEDGYNLVLNRL